MLILTRWSIISNTMKLKVGVFKILYSVLILVPAILFFNCSNMLGEFLHGAHGSFVINDDSTYTFSTSVTLDIDVIDAEKMRFSNNGTSWSSWEDYAVTKSWTLACGHSEKTVYGEFRHSNGNIFQISDAITPLIEEKITASDGASEDYFSGYNPAVHGSCLSISAEGNTVVVGAQSDDSNRGSTYIYKWYGSSWVETKLTASDGDFDDWFGFSVSVSSDGSIVAVGSWRDDIGSNRDQGSVYVYRLNVSSWDETKIIASDGATDDNFGLSVSISADGNTMIVGAYHDDIGGNDNQGSAYVYKWNGSSWIEKKITASDGENGDIFGFHVAISSDGNTLAVGALGDDSSKGSVYLYKWNNNNWIETKITASDGESVDWFGRIVSLSSNGNTLLTSAYRDDVGTNMDQGSAYVYSCCGSSWNETKITASDGELNDWFGYIASISSDGNAIIIGAICDDIGTNVDQGSAYIFRWDGSNWNEIKLTASDGQYNDWFGYSAYVSSDGNTFAVGAPGDDVGANVNQGSAYVY